MSATLITTVLFYAFAAVLVVAGIAGALAGQEPGPIMTAAGIALLLLALVVVIRFVRENPVSGVSE